MSLGHLRLKDVHRSIRHKKRDGRYHLIFKRTTNEGLVDMCWFHVWNLFTWVQNPFFHWSQLELVSFKHQKASIKKNIPAKCCSFVPSVCFWDFETTKTWSTTFDEKHLCRCWLIDKSEWPTEAVENGLNVVARKLKHDSPVGYEFKAYLHDISSNLWYSLMIHEWTVWMPIL